MKSRAALSMDVIVHHVQHLMDPVSRYYCTKQHNMFEEQQTPTLMATDSLLGEAIKQGSPIAMLEWMDPQQERLNKRHLLLAAEFASLEVLKWVAHGTLLDKDVFVAAARSGKLDKLEWLLQQNCPRDRRVISQAIRSGHVTILWWFFKRQFPVGNNACAAACATNNENVLDGLLRDSDLEVDTRCVMQAMKNRHFSLAALLCDHRHVYPWEILSLAVDNNQMEMVEKLLGLYHFQFGTLDQELVARNGDLKLLQRMQNETQPFQTAVFEAGIETANLDMLKWLVSVDCERYETELSHMDWCKSTLSLPVVLWLQSQGLLFNIKALIEAAARKGHHDIVELLAQTTNIESIVFFSVFDVAMAMLIIKLGGRITDLILLEAAHKGKLELIQWQIRRKRSVARGPAQIQDMNSDPDFGVDENYQDILIEAIDHEQFEIMNWLHDKGCRCNIRYLRFSISPNRPSMQIVQWLIDKGYDFSQTFFVLALVTDIEVIKLIKQHSPSVMMPKNVEHDPTLLRAKTLDEIKWSRDNGARYYTGSWDVVINANDLDYLKQLKPSLVLQSTTKDKLFRETIINGTLEQLQWLFAQPFKKRPHKRQIMINMAKRRGNKKVLEFVMLHAHDPPAPHTNKVKVDRPKKRRRLME